MSGVAENPGVELSVPVARVRLKRPRRDGDERAGETLTKIGGVDAGVFGQPAPSCGRQFSLKRGSRPSPDAATATQGLAELRAARNHWPNDFVPSVSAGVPVKATFQPAPTRHRLGHNSVLTQGWTG